MSGTAEPERLAGARWYRPALIVAAVLAALLIAVVVAEHHLKGLLVHAIETRTGREVRIDGALEVHLLSRRPVVTANGVVIDNPPWMPAGITAEAQSVRVRMAWHLSMHPLEIRRLEIEGASLHLVRDPSGRANWHLKEEGPGRGPPLMHSLSVPDAHVQLDDQRRHLRFTGIVSAADADDSGSAPLKITGAGELNARHASFTITGDPLAQVQRGQPYHFMFEEHSGAARLAGRGQLDEPFDMRAFEGTFQVAGPNMRDLYFLVGVKLPQTAAFRLTGRFERRGMRFRYSDLKATSGASDLAGALTVDSSSGRTRLEGELSSGTLHLVDIGARAAGDEDEPPSAPSLSLPATPLRVEGLSRIDAVVNLRVRELLVGSQLLHEVGATVSVDHGLLTLDHLALAASQGRIAGSARLDARAAVPRGVLDVQLADVPLAQFHDKHGDPVVEGMLNARLKLEGSGASFHDMAAHASGTVTAVVPAGTVRASIAEAASLELAGALGLWRKSEKETRVRCGVASFELHEGKAAAHSVVLDTDKALITASGEIDMDSESLDLTVHGRPKTPGLDLRSAVAVRGTLAHPKLALAGKGLAGQAAAAAALGVILTPVAAVLAFVNPGLAHDADCAALLAQAQADTPAPPLKR